MRITEAFLDPDQQGPWPDIAKRCAQRFKQATGRSFDGDLLTQAAHLDRRPPGNDDPVSWGFARKAVAKMHATCSVCGSPAKQRRGEYRGVFLCAACHLPGSFQKQLHWLLCVQDDYSGAARSVLGRHQLPALVRQAIPVSMWRAMVLPDGSNVDYLTDRDLESLTNWLLRLALVLERTAGARAIGRIQQLEARNTQAVEETEQA